MFKPDRIYSITNPNTHKISWYFQAREGDFGPYSSKQEAQLMLKEYIAECVELGKTGGRQVDESIGPANQSLNVELKPKLNYGGKTNWYG